MTIPVDLSPYHLAIDDTSYPEKHNNAMDAVEAAINEENAEINANVLLSQTARDEATAAKVAAAASAVDAAASAADLAAITLNIDEDPDLNATPGTIPVRDARGLIKKESIEWTLPGASVTLPMTDGVMTITAPASEPGISDRYRYDQSAPWYTETRTTGPNLGSYANNTAALADARAAIGAHYYNTTSKTYQELDDLAGSEHETFRAGTQEFPASVGIVLRSAKLIDIYDMTTGTMWARCEGNASDMIINNGTVTSIAFRNGLLVIGSSVGQFEINFADGGRGTHRTTSGTFDYDGDWTDRNDGSGYITRSSDAILSSNVKSVAIGPAPKNYGYSSWGLPNQFILIGTDTTHGASLIHPNGNVYDNTGHSSAVGEVGFNEFGEIFLHGDAQTTLAWFDPWFRDITKSSYKRRSVAQASSAVAADMPYILGGNVALSPLALATKQIIGSASDPSLTIIDEDIYGTGDDDGRDSPATYIGYDSALGEHFISPLVDRACTAAIGMETGTTDLVETELHTDLNAASITNETNATTGWAASVCSISSQSSTTDGSSYAIEVSLDGGNSSSNRFSKDIETDFGLVAGDPVIITFNWAHQGTGDEWSFYTSINETARTVEHATITNSETSFTTVRVEFVFDPDLHKWAIFRENNAGNSGRIFMDSFSCQVGLTDRSQLNENHWALRGTTTRAKYNSGDVALHSGAVESSGANSGAYWEGNFDALATDGVILDCWVVPEASGNKPLISNRPLDGSSNPITVSGTFGDAGSTIYLSSSEVLALANDTGSAVNFTSISTSGSIVQNTLNHILVILSNTDLYVYVNGVLDKITASVTLTAPAVATSYVHPSGIGLVRVGGLDRKATADFYKWKYNKERRLFDAGAECTLQGTGNVVDIAVDTARKTWTALQTDHYTTFDMDNIVVDDGAVSNTGVSIGVHDGDYTILDGANLTLTVAEKSVREKPADLFKERRVFEFDSLIESDHRIFGTTITDPPVTGGDTVGGTTLEWDGTETDDPTITGAMSTLFENEAGSYLTGYTISGQGTGTETISLDISGTAGTPKYGDGAKTETLVYDPAASSSSDIVFSDGGTAFAAAVSDIRIRKVGVPVWLPPGWRILNVWEDGSKVRPDTPDLVRDGAIVRDGEGREGWLSTTDTFNELAIEGERR